MFIKELIINIIQYERDHGNGRYPGEVAEEVKSEVLGNFDRIIPPIDYDNFWESQDRRLKDGDPHDRKTRQEPKYRKDDPSPS